MKWTDAILEEQLVGIISDSGVMPSAHELRKNGRNDIACQLSRRGGFIAWADRLGVKRSHSDSDTGWRGEIALIEMLNNKGFATSRPTAVKSPFDILVNGILRIDVKSAEFAEYGPCRGWFYRIGKFPQADVLALYQLDTKDCYFIPWQICPKTNVTISRGGGKYKAFLNRYDLLFTLVERKYAEADIWPQPEAKAA